MGCGCARSGNAPRAATQSSILCTDYRSEATRAAACMFARWCQENFFKYMREHYNIDRLIEHGCEPIPDTTRVVNPHWRALDAQVRHHNAKLTQPISLHSIFQPFRPNPNNIGKWEHKKATAESAIQAPKDRDLEIRTQSRRQAHRSQGSARGGSLQASCAAKHSPTIKLIAYRAETAMAGLAREHMARHDDARSLMRQLYEPSTSYPTRKARPSLCVCITSPHGSTTKRSPNSAKNSLRPKPSFQAPRPHFSSRWLTGIPVDQDV